MFYFPLYSRVTKRFGVARPSHGNKWKFLVQLLENIPIMGAQYLVLQTRYVHALGFAYIIVCCI